MNGTIIPHVDSDSVDAVISGRGRLTAESVKHSPRIEIQLKASINAEINQDGNFHYALPAKNYDELRADTAIPRLLVLLALPRNEAEWLLHHPDKLILQKCAYFLNLKGLPEKAGIERPTVYVPATNMLTPESLRHLMIKASKMEEL